MTLKEFEKKYLGKQVEYHSYSANAKYQCVDLVNQYIHEVLDSDAKDYAEIIGTNAKDFATRYNPNDFIYTENTPQGIPQEGDIIIWNGNVGGGVGHVAIFLSGDVEKFTSLDQNWGRPQRVTKEIHTYSNVSGWLRPIKTIASSLDMDQEVPVKNFEGKLKTVGFYFYEWEVEKKQRVEQEKQLNSLRSELDEMYEANNKLIKECDISKKEIKSLKTTLTRSEAKTSQIQADFDAYKEKSNVVVENLQEVDEIPSWWKQLFSFLKKLWQKK